MYIDDYLTKPVAKCFICNRYIPVKENKLVLHSLSIKLSELKNLADLPECAGSGLEVSCTITYLEMTQLPDRFAYMLLND